jgi:hypothetical protein
MARFRPLSAYGGIEAGPNWHRDYIGPQSHAIDGTKQRLRDPNLGSPFTLRVVPPPILVDALLGKGEAQTLDAFDPLLRQAFNAAEANLQVLLNDPNATPEQIETARQGLLGTRPPTNGGQNIGIIEAASRSQNNFSRVVASRNQFRQSNFFATGPTRGATLTRLDKMVASNGVRFDPQRVEASQANQAAVSDLTQALDVIVQLNRVLDTPPLTLLVNPETLQIQYAKKQTYSDRNRFNYIFQSWGEEQVKLSITGKSAGFVVGAGQIGAYDLDTSGQTQLRETATGNVKTPSETTSVSGYQYASKWDSAAWQNLMGLFALYRNNGYIYDTGGRPRSEAHLFIGNIEITYDQWVYVGQFENFQYTYSEGKQHGAVEFSFDFTASFMFDLSQGGAVEPLASPTPSPSAATRGGTPFMPPPQTRAARGLEMTPDADTSTAILDPSVDPFDPALQRRAAAGTGTRGRTSTVNPFGEVG